MSSCETSTQLVVSCRSRRRHRRRWSYFAICPSPPLTPPRPRVQSLLTQCQVDPATPARRVTELGRSGASRWRTDRGDAETISICPGESWTGRDVAACVRRRIGLWRRRFVWSESAVYRDRSAVDRASTDLGLQPASRRQLPASRPLVAVLRHHHGTTSRRPQNADRCGVWAVRLQSA